MLTRLLAACGVGVLTMTVPAWADTTDALLRSGIVSYRAGAPAHALAYFSEAARRDPHSALAALWAGVSAMAAGRTREATAWLSAVLARPHTETEARRARAWLDRLGVLRLPASGGARMWLSIAGLARASNPTLTDAQARWIGQAVVAAAASCGLDPRLLASVIYVESRFNHQSISWAGALGLAQLMPETAAAAGVNPRDPWGNILGAAKILRWDYQEFGSWPLALAAYNAGGDAVRRWGGIPPYAETQWYVRAVLSVYTSIAGHG